MQILKPITVNNFIFSPKYRVLRLATYYTIHCLAWGAMWTVMFYNYPRNVLHQFSWIPAFMLFTFPIIYGFIPHLLLKRKYILFAIAAIACGIAGLFINAWNREFWFIPMQDFLGLDNVYRVIWEPSSFLCMCTTAGELSILVLAKHWIIKQRETAQAQEEKVIAELQLLKAQLHPHFLFNTLNNIYSFSLQQLPKTPELILKLSSLLSYMLYDCKAEEVLLEKELEVMKNYIDLEKERYGEKIDISFNIEGNVSDRYIAPLLLLPFLENAFKHGTSEQLEKPWLSFDLAIVQDTLQCKIVNSKNEVVPLSTHGIGIDNVKKRLGLLYSGKHELKLADERDFFVVALKLELEHAIKLAPVFQINNVINTEKTVYETALPAYRR